MGISSLKLHGSGQRLVKGVPISAETAEEAAEWLTIFMSGEATEHDQLEWSKWRAASRENNLAWEHIESIVGHLNLVKSKAAYQAVTTYKRGPSVVNPSRRKAIETLTLSAMFIGAAWAISRCKTTGSVDTTYTTATGEQRNIRLNDGTLVTLDTDSAIAVNFTERDRTVTLRKGAIFVVTSHGSVNKPDTRPFTVMSDDGAIRALGTQFSVRKEIGRTTVAVGQSAVAVKPAEIPTLEQVIRAGEKVDFTARSISIRQAADVQTFSWTRGQIVADDTRLDTFIAELNRYRPGVVKCMDSVSGLRLSGDFPIADTDQILDSLPHVLPVRVRRITRYWTVISAR